MSYRLAISVCLLLLPSAVWSTTLLVRASILGSDFRGTDEIIVYDKARFELVRPLVKDSAVLGFIEDAYSAKEIVCPKLYVTQYVLAPTLLVEGAGPRLVIGNFRNPSSLPAVLKNRYRPLLDCGNGVRLYQQIE